ncbi:MAG: Integrase core domain protein [Microgenomates group bacterium ADurb.Bin238]|nr:MAG: Integrase core domain protein [Microgenomates group bacterium ADurb.Bin238]
MSRVPCVKRHLSADELEDLIRNEKNKRVLERLIFIRNIYDGEEVAKAAGKLGRSKVAGYEWLKRWNDGGPGNLRPTFGGGRPPKLSCDKQAKPKQKLKERRHWTTKEVNHLIEEEFGVAYSLRNTHRFLRSLKMRYAKPYPMDYRRSNDAEANLKNALDDALRKLDDLEAEDDFIVGFLDECSPQTAANTVRRWAFEKPIIVRDTTKYKANTFGFYALGGVSVVEFKENSKKENVCSFLEEVRANNPDRTMLLFLDNLRSHTAQATRQRAEELGITLVYLPPYSPDLNPIEQLWRCLKREISTVSFRSKEEFLAVIEKAYKQLSPRISFAKGWILKFLPQKFNKLSVDGNVVLRLILLFSGVNEASS